MWLVSVAQLTVRAELDIVVIAYMGWGLITLDGVIKLPNSRKLQLLWQTRLEKSWPRVISPCFLKGARLFMRGKKKKNLC